MADAPSHLSASEADARLHGAQLELATITLESGRFSINGWAYGTHGGRDAKFKIQLRALNVSDWRLFDEARIGMLDVHDISETETGLGIESHFPTTLELTTDHRRLEIEQDPEPFSVRRWFRWKNA